MAPRVVAVCSCYRCGLADVGAFEHAVGSVCMSCQMPGVPGPPWHTCIFVAVRLDAAAHGSGSGPLPWLRVPQMLARLVHQDDGHLLTCTMLAGAHLCARVWFACVCVCVRANLGTKHSAGVASGVYIHLSHSIPASAESQRNWSGHEYVACVRACVWHAVCSVQHAACMLSVPCELRHAHSMHACMCACVCAHACRAACVQRALSPLALPSFLTTGFPLLSTGWCSRGPASCAEKSGQRLQPCTGSDAQCTVPTCRAPLCLHCAPLRLPFNLPTAHRIPHTALRALLVRAGSTAAPNGADGVNPEPACAQPAPVEMDLHYIVDQLNAPPFGYSLTLLSFRCASRAVWRREARVPEIGYSSRCVERPRAQREDHAGAAAAAQRCLRLDQPQAPGNLQMSGPSGFSTRRLQRDVEGTLHGAAPG